MTDEKLIEEAARLIDPKAWELPHYPHTYREDARLRSLELAESVRAVFEKAHTPTDDALAVARNIVNQIGDLWSERIPSLDWVRVRQETNDRLDKFVVGLIESLRHAPTDDEREALADRLARRLIEDPTQLMLAEGTGALHVALSESIRSVIEDVYADCGDSDAGVLSSNIARRLAGDLPPAILADAGFRRCEVPEPSDEEFRLIETAGSFREQVSDTASPGSMVDLWLRTAAALEARIQRHASPEPQGEPSDAQVRAAVNAWHRTEGTGREDWYDNPINRERMRAALRAAGCAGGGSRG